MTTIRWGVTVLENGKRVRVTSDGLEWSAERRSAALTHAGKWNDAAEAHLVKLTSKPKGWQPIETAPTAKFVLVVCGDVLFVAYKDSAGQWASLPMSSQVYNLPTHWRHLPKGPK